VVFANEGIVEMGESVNVLHHTGRPVDHREVVAEELLCPVADDVDWSGVVQDLLHSAAIADPIEECSPEVFLVFRNSPAAAGCFADKRVKMAFLLGTFARVEADRSEWCATLSEIKRANAILGELLGGSDRGRAVVGLHQNRTESVRAPIGFEKCWLSAIVAGEARTGSDSKLDFLKEGSKRERRAGAEVSV
jgi:hypothetical protein